MLFANRAEAGRALGDEIARLVPAGSTEQAPLVLGLPRGGVPVAARVAERLHADLEVVVARRIGAPGRPEYGIGAIAEDGAAVFDIDALDALGLTETDLTETDPTETDPTQTDPTETGLAGAALGGAGLAGTGLGGAGLAGTGLGGAGSAATGLAGTVLAGTVARARTELVRQIEQSRGDRPFPPVIGRTVVVVDDGLASGTIAVAALRWLRLRAPARLILGLPVCAIEARHQVDAEADLVICLHMPPLFRSVGRWYNDFRPVTDAEVGRLLHAEMPVYQGRLY